MDRDIKKCYHFLSLKYTATANEVKVRQKIMIKVLRAKNFKTNKTIDKRIDKINTCADKILTNIKNNGVPQSSGILFDTTIENLGSFFTILIIILVFGVVAFWLML